MKGEPTDRRGLIRRLSRMGLDPKDPFRSAVIGEVYLMAGMDCNLRCRACTMWGRGGACLHRDFLARISKPAPLSRLLTFIDEAAAFKPEYLNISGGEPLMTRRWAPLAERGRSHGIKTILTTNGVYLERHAERVAALFDQVSISIACTPAMREKLGMGPPGHGSALIRGLKALADAPGGRPVLRLLCEVFDSNGAHLLELMDHFDEEGIRFDEILFMHLISNKPEVLKDQKAVLSSEFGLGFDLWKGYGYPVRKMDYAGLDRTLKALRKRFPQSRFNIDLQGVKALRDYYAGRKQGLGRAFCEGPWRQVNLFPNGDVWTCPDVILGNLKDQAFAKIWDGPEARALRRRVYQKLLPACRGCFSFYEKEQPVCL
ncbi:MAG: radical SAM protein [Elusimicrobia bacterium]|nr:radical SAM protein [Elusimicrobiota bacterium]